MTAMNSKSNIEASPLKAHQVICRIISVLVCAMGVGTCVYSLTLQSAYLGVFLTSLCWFSGLGAGATGAAGYIVTCEPGQKNYRKPAIASIIVLAAVFFFVAFRFLELLQVVAVAIVALVVMAVVLLVYHFILKKEDPDAL